MHNYNSLASHCNTTITLHFARNVHVICIIGCTHNLTALSADVVAKGLEKFRLSAILGTEPRVDSKVFQIRVLINYSWYSMFFAREVWGIADGSYVGLSFNWLSSQLSHMLVHSFCVSFCHCKFVLATNLMLFQLLFITYLHLCNCTISTNLAIWLPIARLAHAKGNYSNWRLKKSYQWMISHTFRDFKDENNRHRCYKRQDGQRAGHKIKRRKCGWDRQHGKEETEK